MIKHKIEKFSDIFIQSLKSEGASEDDIKLLKRMRGITIESFENNISFDKNTWQNNITFQYDFLESE